jgi:hypothetical protein
MDCDRAVADSRYDLAQRLRSDVTDSVNAIDIRPRGLVRNDISTRVELELSAEYLRCGLATDADEQSVHFKLAPIGKTDAIHSFVRDESRNRTVREEFDIRGLREGIDVDLRCAEGIAAVDEVDLCRKA